MNTKIFIHVGIAKAGSTFLQKNLFPYMKDINYCRSNLFYAPLSDDKPNVFSEEALSGILLGIQPRMKHYRHPELNGTCKYIYANRIKRLYPNAKIIIVCRELDSLLKSSYNENVKQGLYIDFENFKKTVIKECKEDINISKYISYMKKLFSDVYVVDFELLKTETDIFVSRICNFIGCSFPDYKKEVINESLNPVQLKLALLINKFTKSKKNNGGILPLTKYTKVVNFVLPFRKRF